MTADAPETNHCLVENEDDEVRLKESSLQLPYPQHGPLGNGSRGLFNRKKRQTQHPGTLSLYVLSYSTRSEGV